MTTYIEYDLEDGGTILVATSDERVGRVEKAARRGEHPESLKAEKKFSEALEGVRRSALEIKAKLEDLRADEVEVTFGLTCTGKLGNFAVAEVGVEANYTVKLKWNNDPDKKKEKGKDSEKK